MSRKDFQFIANVIASLPTHAPSLRSAQRSAALAFADYLPSTNPLFNRGKFLAACKLADDRAES